MTSVPMLAAARAPRSPAAATGSAAARPGYDGPAAILGILGIGFSVIGFADLALAWYPLAFGSPEWEFGTVTSTLNGMPVPVMGLALLLSAALVSERRRLARNVAIGLFVLAALLVGMGVLWATTLPFAFEPVSNEVVRIGLAKAVAKTAIQLVAYPVLLVVLGIVGRRRSAP